MNGTTPPTIDLRPLEILENIRNMMMNVATLAFAIYFARVLIELDRAFEPPEERELERKIREEIDRYWRLREQGLREASYP